MENYIYYDDIILDNSIIDYVWQIYHSSLPMVLSGKNFPSFKLYELPNALSKYLISMIHTIDTSVKFAAIQSVTGAQDIHIDNGRTLVYNYVLDSGGENSITCWYDKTSDVEFNIIDSVKLMPRRWHKLNVLNYHRVNNLTSTRVAITVFR